MGRRTTVALLVGMALFTGSGCATAQAESRDGDRYSWRGVMPNGGSLEIKGVNGRIVAESASGSEVVVRATLRGRRSDPGEVRIERIEHEGGMTFCAVYPTPRGEEENRCHPGEGGRMNTRNNDVQVEFTVSVPENVPLRARTVNGGVEVVDLGADVDAATVNGDVEVSTRGAAAARTVNGSIDVRMGSGLRDDARFETVNGSISLEVPESFDADVEASWLNGGLESDLPIEVRGRFGRGSASGRVGRGGHALHLQTVNGSIRIRSNR